MRRSCGALYREPERGRMANIEFTTMADVPSLNLDAFEQKTGIHVSTQHYDFGSGWNPILQIALNQAGPDVSQIGSTWQETLANTTSLHIFTPAEIQALGGEDAYYAVERIPEKGVPQIFGIPWVLDTRLILYRADILKKAGVSEQGAFATPEAMADTLSRLQAAGYKYPLVMANGYGAMQILSSFVWGRGGDFRTPDLRKMTLLEPATRQGLLDYFGMHKFIDPANMRVNNQIDTVYTSGQVAVCFSGQWVKQRIRAIAAQIPVVAENTRIAPPPGVPYIGGSYLALWKHSRDHEAALRLIQYLTSPELLGRLITERNTLPARKEALIMAGVANDPDYQLFIRMIQQGRRYQAGKMWAGVEARLAEFVTQLWDDLASNPNLDLPRELERRITDLTPRIERSLLIAG